MTLEALIAIALACPTLPPAMLDIVIGNTLANENASLNERAVNHNPNGTDDYGLGQVNTINLDWTGLRGHEFEPCANLTAAAKVFLVKYNGNPPDQIKKVYAARALAQIARLRTPVSASEPNPATAAQKPPDDRVARPTQSGREILASSRGASQ